MHLMQMTASLQGSSTLWVFHMLTAWSACYSSTCGHQEQYVQTTRWRLAAAGLLLLAVACELLAAAGTDLEAAYQAHHLYNSSTQAVHDWNSQKTNTSATQECSRTNDHTLAMGALKVCTVTLATLRLWPLHVTAAAS